MTSQPFRSPVLSGAIRGMAGSIVDDVIYGCANQAGEDNCNVARMAVLLGGMPVSVPGTTVNRLCGSGMDAVGIAARAIRSGDCKVMLASLYFWMMRPM